MRAGKNSFSSGDVTFSNDDRYSCPFTDLISTLRKATCNLWNSEWSNLPVSYAGKYRQLVPAASYKTWSIDHYN